MSDQETIVTKLKEIGDQIKHVQDTNDRLKEKYDGLDFTNIKENAEKAAESLEEVQEIKQKIAAFADIIGDNPGYSPVLRIFYQHPLD